jgi:signal transduction histidine kinase
LEPVNISALIEDTIDLYREVAEEKEIAVAIVAPKDMWVRADRNRMRQVLANLLDNAIKYMPRGGKVDLIAYQEETQVMIVVEDTGVGISAAELPKIWDRLYRGDQSHSQRGLGLGLSLVKAVVAAHHGAVQVSSIPGAGSRFTLVLPIPSAPIR